MALTLTINTDEGRARKGRSFAAEVLALANASALWDAGGSGATLRPIFMLLATSDAEARPVLENLRAGKVALVRDTSLPQRTTPLNLPRSAGCAFELQRTPAGTLITAYLPELFAFQPRLIDPELVRFVVLPAREDLEGVPVTNVDEKAARLHLTALGIEMNTADAPELVRTAVLWGAYLDQRSDLPIPPEIAFRTQLLIAALEAGLAVRAAPVGRFDLAPGRTPLGFSTFVAPGVALAPGIALHATHEELGVLLATEIVRYDAAITARRSSPLPRSRARPLGHQQEIQWPVPSP